MALDISRIGGLSSVGLMADSVLVELDRASVAEATPVNQRVFKRAADYLASAMEGLSDVQYLDVRQNTVHAVNAYQTISRALPQARPEDLEDVRRIIEQVRALCDQLAQGEELNQEQILKLNAFFESLSDFTGEERKLLLRESRKKVRPFMQAYVY